MSTKLHAIQEAERLMMPLLNEGQLEKLHAVLGQCLLEVEDLAAKRRCFGNNAQIIEAFLAAKSVEGCLARTIDYYSRTLEGFVSALDTPLVGVMADDV